MEQYTPSENHVIFNIRVHLDSANVCPVIHLSQYDQSIPILALEIFSVNGSWKLSNGFNGNVQMIKPDRTHVYTPVLGCSEDGAIVYVPVVRQMTAAFGIGKLTIELSDSEGIVHTGVIVLDIARNPVPIDSYESTDDYKTIVEIKDEIESDFNSVKDSVEILKENIDVLHTVQENIEDIKQAPSAAKKAEDFSNLSKSYAIGEGAPTEHPNQEVDNAKYYSEQAKNGAKIIEENREGIQAIQENLEAVKNAGQNAERAEAAADSAQGDADRAEEAARNAQSIAQGQKGYYPTPEELRAAHEIGEAGDWAIVGSTDTVWVWDDVTESWLNSGNNIDLSNYYTKNDADDMQDELQRALTQATDEKLAEKLDKDAAAEAAKKLESPRSIQTDLAGSAPAPFDGSADITPGVTGVLPVTNGGTGMGSIPKLYNVIGLLVTGTNTEDAVRGYGFAEIIEYPKGFFKIIFHLQIEVGGTTGGAVGVDAQEISKAVGRTVVPAGLGTGLYFDANGTLTPSINGYGIVLAPVSNRWWMVSRMYSTAGNTGGWGGTLFPKGVRLYGEVFGVAN